MYIDMKITMIADGTVLRVELHQSAPQKYSPSSPVPWTSSRQSRLEVGTGKCIVKIPLLRLIQLGLACQSRLTPQIEVHHMLSEKIIALMNISVVWFLWLPCTNASYKTYRLERNTLEMLFSSKKYLFKWCFSSTKTLPTFVSVMLPTSPNGVVQHLRETAILTLRDNMTNTGVNPFMAPANLTTQRVVLSE